MPRIGPASRDSVPPEQVEAFDRFVEERGAIPHTGRWPSCSMRRKCWPGENI